MTNMTNGHSQVGKKSMNFPMMVGSSKCNISKLSPSQLVKVKEDHFELGGYFIRGGNEKVIRLLNMNKRNHPMGLNRGGWAKRRPGYLESGVMIRSINKWEQCANLNLHINKDDEIETVFYVNKRLIHLPLLILVRALCDWNDLEIFNEFMQTMTDEKNYISALKRMLSDVTNRNQMRNQNDERNCDKIELQIAPISDSIEVKFQSTIFNPI